jgi:hypothetical protein
MPRSPDWRRSPSSWISAAVAYDHAWRLAGLELALNRDKPSVGSVESSRKDRGDVEGDGWIASKNRRRVGDIELRLLQSWAIYVLANR